MFSKNFLESDPPELTSREGNFCLYSGPQLEAKFASDTPLAPKKVGKRTPSIQKCKGSGNGGTHAAGHHHRPIPPARTACSTCSQRQRGRGTAHRPPAAHHHREVAPPINALINSQPLPPTSAMSSEVGGICRANEGEVDEHKDSKTGTVGSSLGVSRVQ